MLGLALLSFLITVVAYSATLYCITTADYDPIKAISIGGTIMLVSFISGLVYLVSWLIS